MSSDNSHIIHPGTTEVSKYCWKECLSAEGRRQAFAYALTVKCDELLVTEKLAEKEDLLQSELGGMKSGAGPRIFTDGFIAALREIVDMIRNTQIEK